MVGNTREGKSEEDKCSDKRNMGNRGEEIWGDWGRRMKLFDALVNSAVSFGDIGVGRETGSGKKTG